MRSDGCLSVCNHTNESWSRTLIYIHVHELYVSELVRASSYSELYFIVLFLTLYKVDPTFKSVNETIVCAHSIEIYWQS